jgi:hypothetical protein
MKKFQDAYGQYFEHYLKTKTGFEIVEREDGHIDVGRIQGYFAEYKEWSKHVKEAMKYVHGRILDIGCGKIIGAGDIPQALHHRPRHLVGNIYY